MSTTSSAHIERHHVHIARSSWGNTRPHFALCLNLLRLHPGLKITFVGNVDNKAQLHADLARWAPSADPEYHGRPDPRDRLDLLLLGQVNDEARGYAKTSKMEVVIAQQYDGVYRALLGGESPWPGIRATPVRPTLVVAAMGTLKWVMKTKKDVEGDLGIPQEGQGRIKMFAFFGMSAWMAALCWGNGPRSTPWTKEIMPNGEAKGLSEHDAWEDWVHRDVLMETPGLPKHYCYEQDPTELMRLLPSPYESLGHALADHMDECDGYISPYLPDIEPDAEEMWQTCFTRPGARWIGVGPQFAPSYWIEGKGDAEDAQKDYGVGNAGSEAIHFLDAQVDKYGPRSVLNVSWGSNLFPPDNKQVVALFEALNAIEPPMPYMVAIPNKELPPEIAAVIEKGGRGLALGWIPQQTVLRHPAIGWQLTHGGANSTSECLLNGIPMITWPLMAEQPWSFMVNARLLEIALPMYQVRRGYSIGKPVFATGEIVEGTPEAVGREVTETIRKARGEEGKKVRANVERWSRVMRTSRETGVSHAGMVALGHL